MYHEIALQLYDGRLHLAPLKDPQRVLDIGTGTGIWAIDMADTYPCAEVIGIDLRHAAYSLALSAVTHCLLHTVPLSPDGSLPTVDLKSMMPSKIGRFNP